MLRNFIITSLRILWRNKVVSAINILSLSIGITAFLLILMYVHYETSYDKFNENYDRIYRLEGDEYAKLPPLIGEYIADKIPEIEKVTQLQIDRIRNFNYIPPENIGDGIGIPVQVFRADSAIFDVFTMPLIHGNPKHALSKPFSVVLTENFASKLFGSRDPMGKTIIFDNIYRDNNEYMVTGILQDLPPAHVNIDALISRVSADITHPHRIIRANNNWKDYDWWYGTYVLLSKNAKSEVVSQKINQVLADINDEDMLPTKFTNFDLKPLKDLYFKGSATKMIYGEHGNMDILWSFMAIGLFVFLLAIINYINLTTARSTLRYKEVLIKKVMGSGKALLRGQFIAESTLVAVISFLFALTIIQLLTPKFNQLLEANINLSSYNSLYYWVVLPAGILLTGMISGMYPAIILTKFNSLANIQAKAMQGMQGVHFRRLLLTFQFCISIILIIGILTNLRQLHFVKNADLGFTKDQVIQVQTPAARVENNNSYRNTFKEQLLQHPEIIKITCADRKATESLGGHHVQINGVEGYFKAQSIDPDFLDVMEVELIEGRNFSWQRESDNIENSKEYRWLINETAARKYWDESPVENVFFMKNADGIDVAFRIIGIIKDVHRLSLHHKVEPTFYYWRDGRREMSIKVSTNDLPNTIEMIEKNWKKVFGSQPFIYSFLDEEFDAQYKGDERAATIIGYFTVIAIIIACMGLFGLSSFMAVRRTKEIGIRKALGASSKTIFVMLSREYINWILLSALIASPIAWFAMNKWLQTFAYRIELGPGVFIIAAIIALAIGLITVGWQALKSAVANPVEALRYE